MPVIVTAGKTWQFQELKPVIINVRGKTIGVYKYRGRYHAYLNECAHQGGPVCEGNIVGRVKTRVSQTDGSIEEYTSDELLLGCPWHGVEYNIEDGKFTEDPRLQLKSFPVRVRGDDVVVYL